MQCFISKQYPYTSLPPPLSNEWNRFSNRIFLYTPNPQAIYQKIANRKAYTLLHRQNASQLPAKLKYAAIAKGMWTNRKTSWASQSVQHTTTNPNVNQFLRVNKAYLDMTTGANIEQIQTIIPTSCQPNFAAIPYSDPTIPPPPPPSSNVNPSLPIIPPVSTFDIKNLIIIPESKAIAALDNQLQQILEVGGSLVCTATANPCTGAILQEYSTNQCYPSSDSNVPGNGMLCSFPNTAMSNLADTNIIGKKRS